MISIMDISAEDNKIYITYCVGYEENYVNEIMIDLLNKRYHSRINDYDKSELTYVIDSVIRKLDFISSNCFNTLLGDFYSLINQSMIEIVDHCQSDDKQIQNLMRATLEHTRHQGRIQIEQLQQEYVDNSNDDLFVSVIQDYYELYLIKGSKLFHIEHLDMPYSDYTYEVYQMYEDKEINYTDQDIVDYCEFARTLSYNIRRELDHIYVNNVDTNSDNDNNNKDEEKDNK